MPRSLDDIAYSVFIELGRPFNEKMALAELREFKKFADSLKKSLDRHTREMKTKKQVRRSRKHLQKWRDYYAARGFKYTAYWYTEADRALGEALKLQDWGGFDQTENMAMSAAAAAIRKSRNQDRGKRLRTIASLFFEAATGERDRPLNNAYRRYTAANPA